MKRNVIVSMAAVLVAGAAVAHAGDILVAGEFTSENVIVESAAKAPAGYGNSYDEMWKEEYPFPRHFGPID